MVAGVGLVGLVSLAGLVWLRWGFGRDGQRGFVGCLRKEQVNRRQLPRSGEYGQCFCECSPHVCVARNQSGTGYGCEWDGGHELGVIRNPIALMGVRPCMIEDELAP